MQQDRAKPPPADFKIVGGFQRASECLVEGGDNRIDAIAGNGSGQVNASATKERRRTETCLTLMLNLEGRNGLAAATTAYKMTVDKTELNRSVSIYVGGTGIGAGRKVTVTQDLGVLAQPGFEDGDGAIAVLEMRRRSLEFAEREALVEFAFSTVEGDRLYQSRSEG